MLKEILPGINVSRAILIGRQSLYSLLFFDWRHFYYYTKVVILGPPWADLPSTYDLVGPFWMAPHLIWVYLAYHSECLQFCGLVFHWWTALQSQGTIFQQAPVCQKIKQCKEISSGFLKIKKPNLIIKVCDILGCIFNVILYSWDLDTIISLSMIQNILSKIMRFEQQWRNLINKSMGFKIFDIGFKKGLLNVLPLFRNDTARQLFIVITPFFCQVGQYLSFRNEIY